MVEGASISWRDLRTACRSPTATTAYTATRSFEVVTELTTPAETPAETLMETETATATPTATEEPTTTETSSPDFGVVALLVVMALARGRTSN